jgi:hypothetical protein
MSLVCGRAALWRAFTGTRLKGCDLTESYVVYIAVFVGRYINVSNVEFVKNDKSLAVGLFVVLCDSTI